MLELIVLGHIPGTHLQLTFLQVLALASLFIATVALSHEIRVRRSLMLAIVIKAKMLKRLSKAHSA